MSVKEMSVRVAGAGLSLVLFWGSGLLQHSVALSAAPPEHAQQQAADVDSTAVDFAPSETHTHQVVLSKTRKFNLYL